MNLYTKNGRPLQVRGDDVHSRSGTYVGRIRSGRVFDPSGRYVGTIVGDRLVYRSTESARLGPISNRGSRVGTARANRVGSAIWGDEPPIPD